jgi:hypothetical protein
VEPAGGEQARDQHEEEGAAGEQQALRPLRGDEGHVGEDDAHPAPAGQQGFHRLTWRVRIKRILHAVPLLPAVLRIRIRKDPNLLVGSGSEIWIRIQTRI